MQLWLPFGIEEWIKNWHINWTIDNIAKIKEAWLTGGYFRYSYFNKAT